MGEAEADPDASGQDLSFVGSDESMQWPMNPDAQYVDPQDLLQLPADASTSHSSYSAPRPHWESLLQSDSAVPYVS